MNAQDWPELGRTDGIQTQYLPVFFHIRDKMTSWYFETKTTLIRPPCKFVGQDEEGDEFSSFCPLMKMFQRDDSNAMPSFIPYSFSGTNMVDGRTYTNFHSMKSADISHNI